MLSDADYVVSCLYKVQGIPATVLISRWGKVLNYGKEKSRRSIWKPRSIVHLECADADTMNLKRNLRVFARTPMIQRQGPEAYHSALG